LSLTGLFISALTMAYTARNSENNGTRHWDNAVQRHRSGTGGSKATALTKAGKCYFLHCLRQERLGLWKTDGSVDGTVFVKDIFSGPDNSKVMSRLTAAGTNFSFRPMTGMARSRG